MSLRSFNNANTKSRDLRHGCETVYRLTIHLWFCLGDDFHVVYCIAGCCLRRIPVHVTAGQDSIHLYRHSYSSFIDSLAFFSEKV